MLRIVRRFSNQDTPYHVNQTLTFASETMRILIILVKKTILLTVIHKLLTTRLIALGKVYGM